MIPFLEGLLCSVCEQSRVFDAILTALKLPHHILPMYSIDQAAAADGSEVLEAESKKKKECTAHENGLMESNANEAAVPDLLGGDDDIMHVTIGGQSISIKTKPSAAAVAAAITAADVSDEGTPEGSPEIERSLFNSNDAKSEVAGAAAETKTVEAEVESSAQDSVIDLLADFSSSCVSSEPQPTTTNTDIMDLLCGINEVSGDCAPPPPVEPLIGGGIGKVAVVGRSRPIVLTVVSFVESPYQLVTVVDLFFVCTR